VNQRLCAERALSQQRAAAADRAAVASEVAGEVRSRASAPCMLPILCLPISHGWKQQALELSG
jgi:hypothetical protein